MQDASLCWWTELFHCSPRLYVLYVQRVPLSLPLGPFLRRVFEPILRLDMGPVADERRIIGGSLSEIVRQLGSP